MLRCLLPLACLAVLALTTACGGGGGPTGPIIPPGPDTGSTAVQAGVDTVVGDTATVFEFSGQASDIEGGLVSHAWDTNGDGTAESTIDRPSLGLAAGTHTVLLTVANAGGDENTAQVVVGVRDPAAPTAPLAPGVALRVWTLHGTAPAEVFCRAYAEDPDGGAITDYAFDIDGDGTTDVSGTSPTATFTLPASGVFEPSVTVTDDEAATSTATATIVLCDQAPYPDQSPSAMIAVPAGEALTDTTTPLDLVAIGSDIDGGAIASIDWDIDGDGVFGDLTGRSVSPTFATEGVHRVRVRLTDDEGNAPAQAQVDVLVSNTPPTTGTPSARAWAEALVVAPSQDVLFHASGAGGDAPLTFSWDFDGDGTEDSAAPDPRFRYFTAGVYRPRCTVTDADGDASSSDMTVLVEGCGASAAPFFRYSCDDLLMLHGGTAELSISSALASGSSPTMYRVLWKAGTPSDDPDGADLDVEDHTMQALPPATSAVAIPAGGVIPLELESLAADGPQRLTCYTVGVRIETPGVRVQVLTCQACVAHDLVQASITPFDLGAVYQAPLSVEMDTSGFGALPGTPPDVFEIEMRFDGFTPEVDQFNATGLLSAGWSEASLATGHRLFTTTLPVRADIPQKLFQVQFVTDSGSPPGPPLTAGEILLRDANGRLIGRQRLFP